MSVRESVPHLSPLSRFAILVDVGYLSAAAGDLLFGVSSRRSYRVDAEGAVRLTDAEVAAVADGIVTDRAEADRTNTERGA